MVVATKMRNRIIGFLIIVSFVLILLPLMMSDKKQTPNNDLIAINQNGAITDTNGQLIQSQEKDYGSLLEPVDDSKNVTPTPLPSAGDNSSNSQALYNTDNQGTVEILDFPTDTAPSQTTTAVAPTEQPQRETNNAPHYTEELVASNATNTSTATKASNNTVASKPQPSKAQAQAKPQAQVPVHQAQVTPAPAVKGAYTVQVGAFSVVANANKLAETLKQNGISARVAHENVNGKSLYKVYAGSSNNKNELNNLVTRIESIAKIKGKVVAQ